MKAYLKILAASALALFLNACGTVLPGKLYQLSDATVLEFEIETSTGTGAMRATHPKTGEKFTGQYTGVTRGSAPIVVMQQPPAGNTHFERGMQQGAAQAAAQGRPTYATARGILIGDKGTTIQLLMEIQPSLRPKGSGEGTDNKGERYQVQF